MKEHKVQMGIIPWFICIIDEFRSFLAGLHVNLNVQSRWDTLIWSDLLEVQQHVRNGRHISSQTDFFFHDKMTTGATSSMKNLHR